jgi:endonuclease/exonuclease/phosphatase family metal-dependent hydrolase
MRTSTARRRRQAGTAIRTLTVVFLASLLGATFLLPATAQDFLLYSQNLLRFGHGKRLISKKLRSEHQCERLTQRVGQVDIILIQELMLNYDPCGFKPGDFSFHAEPTPAKGTYQEFYGFLWAGTPRTETTNNKKVQVGPKITVSAKPEIAKPASAYLRPPVALLFEITPPGERPTKVWIANYHARWTGGITLRRQEIANVAQFFVSLTNGVVQGQNKPSGGWPVIIAGDWNLAADDSDNTYGFAPLRNLKSPPVIRPNDATSLTKDGEESLPYDHFVVSNQITVTQVDRYPDQSEWALWSTEVSDHLGIQATLTLAQVKK